MSATYSNILFPVVFSTKDRKPCITPQVRPRLYEYLGGVIRDLFIAFRKAHNIQYDERYIWD